MSPESSSRICPMSSTVLLVLGVVAMLLILLPARGASAAEYAYRVTDPMVGDSVDDLNTAFWEPWSTPAATGGATVSSEGFSLSGQANYLGLVGDGGPLSKWAMSGDFQISIHLSQGSSSTRRNHVTVYELVDCTTLGPQTAGVWGGAGTSVGNTDGDHYAMPAGISAYYLFVKKGDRLVIHEGNAQGVSESDTAVLEVTLQHPDAPYIFSLGMGSPNDNTMTAKDFVLETEELASCPSGASVPPAWSNGGEACSCDCPNGAVAQYSHRVTDPLVGTSMSDLNTSFWEPWSGPNATGEASISSDGFSLSGQVNYLGLVGDGGPLSKWAMIGNFRIKIRLRQGSSSTRRNHATIYELVDCTTLGAQAAGVWGGAGTAIGNTSGDHYAMPEGGTAYYLFVKKGNHLVIHEGNGQGVSESDKVVLDVTLQHPDAPYIFSIGVGSPNDNTMTANDFVLESQGLTACPTGGVAPAAWCACNCDGSSDPSPTGGEDDGEGGGCSMSGRGGPAGAMALLALAGVATLLGRRRRG